MATIRSLKDCAVQSAASAEVLLDAAAYALDNIPGFPDECPAEHRAQLDEGWLLRYSQLHKTVEYGKFGETWVPLSEVKGDAKPIEVQNIGPAYAMSFTQHEVGRMGDTHGASFKALIVQWRAKFSTYKSNRYKDLANGAKEVLRERNGEPKRSRKPTKDWAVWAIEDWLPMLTERFKSAKARGDATADASKLDKVKAAAAAALK